MDRDGYDQSGTVVLKKGAPDWLKTNRFRDPFQVTGSFFSQLEKRNNSRNSSRPRNTDPDWWIGMVTTNQGLRC